MSGGSDCRFRPRFPQRQKRSHVIMPCSVNSCNPHRSLHAGWIPAEALAPMSRRSGAYSDRAEPASFPRSREGQCSTADAQPEDPRRFLDSRYKWMAGGEQMKGEEVGGKKRKRNKNALQTSRICIAGETQK